MVCICGKTEIQAEERMHCTYGEIQVWISRHKPWRLEGSKIVFLNCLKKRTVNIDSISSENILQERG